MRLVRVQLLPLGSEVSLFSVTLTGSFLKEHDRELFHSTTCPPVTVPALKSAWAKAFGTEGLSGRHQLTTRTVWSPKGWFSHF